MSSTGHKVGTGAVVVAVLGLLTALITFADNHWPWEPDGSAEVRSSTPLNSDIPRDVNRDDATVYLSRDQVPVDERLNVSGEGFAPNQVVVIRVGTFEVARTRANGQGGFSNIEIQVPDFYRNFQRPLTVPVQAQSKPDFQFRDSRDLVIT